MPHSQDIRLERRCAFLGRHKCCKCVWSASTTTPCSKAGSASAESASPTSAYPAFGGGTSHFETLIPWLALCNARARRAGEGIGHAVHEGDDSLMSLQDFRLRSSGAFFLGHPRVEDPRVPISSGCRVQMGRRLTSGTKKARQNERAGNSEFGLLIRLSLGSRRQRIRTLAAA